MKICLNQLELWLKELETLSYTRRAVKWRLHAYTYKQDLFQKLSCSHSFHKSELVLTGVFLVILQVI